jgi:plastocyanin
MTERFFADLALRRLSRRSAILSLAVAAMGSAIVSCSGPSTAATSGGAAPTAAPATGGAAANAAAAPNAAPASGGATVKVAAAPAPNVAPATGATSASASATPQSATAPAAPAVASPVVIKMTDQFKFDPDTVTIPKGTTVEWQSSGTQPHTVTFDPAKAMDKSHVVLPTAVTPFDSGLIDVGKSYKYTFTVAGEYHYICIPHEAMGMLGTIKVT